MSGHTVVLQSTVRWVNGLNTAHAPRNAAAVSRADPEKWNASQPMAEQPAATLLSNASVTRRVALPTNRRMIWMERKSSSRRMQSTNKLRRQHSELRSKPRNRHSKNRCVQLATEPLSSNSGVCIQVALALHDKEQAQQAYDSVKTTYDEDATQARQSRSKADETADKAAKSQITHDDQKVIYAKAKKTYEDLKAKAEAAASSLAEATAAHEQADSTVLAQKAAADEALVTVKSASEQQVAALGRDKEDAAKALDQVWQDAKKSADSKQVILSSAQDAAQKAKNALAAENRASLAAEAADKQAQQARADAVKDVADQVGAKIDAAEKAEQLKLAVNTLEAELKTAEERASNAAAAVAEQKSLLVTRASELSAADNAHAKAKDALQTAEMHVPRTQQAVDTAKTLLVEAAKKLEEATKKHDAAVTELGAHTSTLDKLGGDGAGEIGLAKNYLAGREAIKHMAQEALKTAEAAQVPVAAAKETAATQAAAAVVAATKSAEEALAKAATVAQEQKHMEREHTSDIKNVQTTLPKELEDMGSSIESETGKSERAAEKVAQLTSEIEANEMTNHQVFAASLCCG